MAWSGMGAVTAVVGSGMAGIVEIEQKGNVGEGAVDT